jgi:ribA/ribD-fused uncharacterized protein
LGRAKTVQRRGDW